MPNIFISYRRLDSNLYVGRIYDRLEREFGPDAVFMDIDDIPDGENFPQVLQQELSKTDALLVVIGPNWTTITGENGKLRLYEPGDYTRMEVEAGLAREKCVVIPLLVGGAKMPLIENLPDSLHEFINLQAREIREGRDFRGDMERLIRRLHELDEKPAPEPEKAAPQPPTIDVRPTSPEPEHHISEKQPPVAEFVPRLQRVRRIQITVVLLLTFVAALLVGLYNVANRDVPPRTGTPRDTPDIATGIVAAGTIAQEFRNDFNAIVAEFGRGDCLGFTPDEEFVYGADWLYSFDDEGLVDDITLDHNAAISPDGTMAAVNNDALYRLGDDPVRLFSIGGEPKFSADGRYIASHWIGIHEIATGRLVRNAREYEEYTAISPNGRYVVSQGTASTGPSVVDLETGDRIIEDDDGNGFAEAQFSPSGRLLAIAGVGVFEIPSGQLIIESEATGTTFSPDDRIIGGGQAIADTTTGETVLEFEQRLPTFFTPDSKYMALQGDGVYDLSSMTRLFILGDTGAAVSHDGQYVASQLTGWFRLPDDELVRIDDSAGDAYYYSPPLFSPDDQFVAFDGDGIYSLVSGRKVLDYPHDFVGFAPERGVILVALEDEGGCAMIGDSGAYANSEPLE
jgi:hypothetical protein